MGFPDRIERTVDLAQPREAVSAALTTAEGLGTWFGNESARIDLRPGGAAQMTWTGGFKVAIRVERVEERHAAGMGGGARATARQGKELTRARDALAAERRRMPWLAVSKPYAFDGPHGRASLRDLFEGRRQLVVYRAFFEPGVLGWPEHACHGCSLLADQVAPAVHLNARDTTFAYASRAPQPDIARLMQRMGWTMPWYTITDDWDADFGVDEYHGTNVFFRDGDQVFRTYFVNNRGDEALGSTWSYLDLTPFGRQETWEDSPGGYPQTPPYNWWNWNDEYDHPELAQGPMKGWSDVSEATAGTSVAPRK